MSAQPFLPCHWPLNQTSAAKLNLIWPFQNARWILKANSGIWSNLRDIGWVRESREAAGVDTRGGINPISGCRRICQGLVHDWGCGVWQVTGNSYISIIFVELHDPVLLSPLHRVSKASMCKPNFTQGGINPDVQIFPPIKTAQSTLRHGVPLQAGVRSFLTVLGKPAAFLLAR